MTLLLGLLLAAQDRISALDHDDIAVREAAARELRELGDCAEPELRARLEAGVSLEAAGRIRGLLDGFDLERRIDAFQGGKEIAGLRCAVRIEGRPEDARRELRVEIMNVGPGPRDIAGIRSWGLRLPGYSWRSTSSEAEIRITGGPALPSGQSRYSIACGGHRSPDFLALQRGEGRSFTYSLDAGRLAPGRYELSIVYTAPRKLEGVEADVLSNVVDFEVGPPAAEPAGTVR